MTKANWHHVTRRGPPATVLIMPGELASVESYAAVFESLARKKKYVTGRAMLVAHYRMPHRVTTMRHLAIAVCGVAEFRLGNLLYGGFAARVRRDLELKRPKYEIGVLATWPEAPIDQLGEFAFRLRPEVATALEQLGWHRSDAATLAAPAM